MKDHGYSDIELMKRIVAIQRCWRHGISIHNFRYSGPLLDDYEKDGRYFGFRHGLYFVRWNRRQRWRLYKSASELDRHGDGDVTADCFIVAYIQFVKETGF